jgi:hypothetical protein
MFNRSSRKGGAECSLSSRSDFSRLVFSHGSPVVHRDWPIGLYSQFELCFR